MTSSEPRIPGTHVPDNAIHRASLWVEALKYPPEQREDAEAGPVDEFLWRAFLEETGLDVTVEQLKEAATYYGINTLAMLTGGRIEFVIPGPGGRPIDGRGIFASVWLDAFMHGVATAQGRRGRSNEELREEARKS